jgi:hypothetical protein
VVSRVALGAVDQLAHRVEVPEVAAGLLEHVQEHPPQARASRGERLAESRVVQGRRGDDGVRRLALPFVVVQQLRQRNVVDDEVGVLDLAELRVLLRPSAGERDLEPAVLGPAQVRHDPRHGHERGRREHDAVRGLVGEALALERDDRPLQIEPADELGALVRDEGRAGPRERHAPGG